MLNQEQIKQIIPHREPFIFPDAITELEPGVKACGYWDVAEDEYFFKGHFPDYPVVPGVIAVEALAQVGAVALLSMPDNKDKIAFFAGIDSIRFKKEIKPRDRLSLEVEIIKIKGPIGKGKVVAKLNGEIAVQGELMFALKTVD